MCIDYTDLNKACPKDNYPFSCIDQLVDLVLGHEVLSFLEAYNRYYQILMHHDDVENIVFITKHRTYSYTVIPFGLKNTGTTF